jgi:hypothetical protein
MVKAGQSTSKQKKSKSLPCTCPPRRSVTGSMPRCRRTIPRIVFRLMSFCSGRRWNRGSRPHFGVDISIHSDCLVPMDVTQARFSINLNRDSDAARSRSPCMVRAAQAIRRCSRGFLMFLGARGLQDDPRQALLLPEVPRRRRGRHDPPAEPRIHRLDRGRAVSGVDLFLYQYAAVLCLARRRYCANNGTGHEGPPSFTLLKVGKVRGLVRQCS